MLLIFSKSKITQSVMMTVGSLITFSPKIIKILFFPADVTQYGMKSSVCAELCG